MTRPTASECRAAIERLGFWLSAMRASEECRERDDCPACVAWREWRRAESEVRELAARSVDRLAGYRVAVAVCDGDPPPSWESIAWYRLVQGSDYGLTLPHPRIPLGPRHRKPHAGTVYPSRDAALAVAATFRAGYWCRLIRVVRRADR